MVEKKVSLDDLGQVNEAFQHDAATSESDSEAGCRCDAEEGIPRVSATHSVVLDVSTTSFVDTVAVTTLKNVRAGFFFRRPFRRRMFE